VPIVAGHYVRVGTRPPWRPYGPGIAFENSSARIRAEPLAVLLAGSAMVNRLRLPHPGMAPKWWDGRSFSDLGSTPDTEIVIAGTDLAFADRRDQRVPWPTARSDGVACALAA